MKGHSLVYLVSLAFVSVAFLATPLSFADDGLLSLHEMMVVSAELKADRYSWTGPCPVTVRFQGVITTDTPGIVAYTFARSDGATGPVFKLDFKTAGTQTVSTTWTLGDPTSLPHFEGWEALKIVSPNEIESRQEPARFEVNCGASSDSDSKNKTTSEQPFGIQDKKESTTDSKIQPPDTSSQKIEPGAQKFAGRKREPLTIPKEVPPGERPAVIKLEALPMVPVAEVSRVKTIKVGDKETFTASTVKIDPTAIQDAKRSGDIRLRGPNLSNTAGSSTDPDMAAAGDNVYVVWTDGTSGSGEIMLAISTDHGATFWPPVDLSNTPTASHNPHVAASGSKVYVVWVEDALFPTGVVTVSNDSGDSFTTPTQLDSIPGDTQELSVTADSNHGYAAWKKVERSFGLTGASSAGNERVMFCALDDHRTTNVVSVPWHIQDVSIAAGGRNIYVTWSTNWRGRDLDPYFSTSTDGGASFRIDQYDEDQASPRGDYNDQWGGGVKAFGDTVIWYYESNRDASHNVRFYASQVGGDGIFHDHDLYYLFNRLVYNPGSDAYRENMSPHFVLDGSDRFVGAWLVARPRFSGFENELHYCESDRVENVISGNPGEPRVAVGDATHSTVVYTNPTGGSSRDVFATLIRDGQTFNISANAGNSIQPRVVASGPNYVVVWTDDTPGNNEIFFHAIPFTQ